MAVKVSTRVDGSIEAAYLRFGTGKVAKTKEIVRNRLLADYDAAGTLLGLEVLGPVPLSALKRPIPKDDVAATVFATNAVPYALVKS